MIFGSTAKNLYPFAVSKTALLKWLPLSRGYQPQKNVSPPNFYIDLNFRGFNATLAAVLGS